MNEMEWAYKFIRTPTFILGTLSIVNEKERGRWFG
jgi:hypothetical protein